ncbi:hypothetical protein AAHC03_026684 [Spirometra sp. Aus1]
MAEYLASIFGTEKDKVNCSFYFKIGACRHGEQCSRLHNKPTFSQNAVANMTEVQAQQLFDEFFEEVFVECEEKYGEIEEMNVCDNLGDHLVGNVYIKSCRRLPISEKHAVVSMKWGNALEVAFATSCTLSRSPVNSVGNSIIAAKDVTEVDVGVPVHDPMTNHTADQDHREAEVRGANPAAAPIVDFALRFVSTFLLTILSILLVVYIATCG